MHDDDDEEDWSAEQEAHTNMPPPEIQKLFAEMELKAKKALHYLVLEGFIEPTSKPGVYKYTPEGLVMAQHQYKKMQDEGLL